MNELSNIQFYELKSKVMEQPTYRTQKYLTISDEQAEFIKANKGTMSIEKLATMLGITKNKCYGNMRILKLTKDPKRKPHYTKPAQDNCKVIDFDTNGYFDEIKWGKLYQY